MRIDPEFMDFGDGEAIDLADLLATEVVTRTEYAGCRPRRPVATPHSVLLRYEVAIFAEGREILVHDKDLQHDLWNLDEPERRVDALLHVFGDSALNVGTVEAAPVPLTIEVRDDPPGLIRDLDRWDHVIQADLLVPSGRLGVCNVWSRQPLDAYPVARGRHRVRLSYGDLDRPRGVPGEPGRFTSAGHRYRLEIWPVPEDDVAGPVVLKRWPKVDAIPAS